ncbi:Ald1 [Symbiodinium sp. CCMP2456]|nr:Ald1 [Symbiodinium sp. CCMP2456]
MSFWEIPGMKAGVLTGDLAWSLVEHAKKYGYALAAVTCTSTSAIDSVLAAARELNRPAVVQFSEGGSAFIAGKSLPNEQGVNQASILGAVAGAHFVRAVAPAYGIPVLINTGYCGKQLLPWFDGMLESDEAYFKQYGETLFSMHTLDFSQEPDADNIELCKTYFKRMSSVNQILEMGIGITNGSSIFKVYQGLSPISEKFTIAAACKAGSVVKPELLKDMQAHAREQIKAATGKDIQKPLSFVVGSGFEKDKIPGALAAGVVKMNVDINAQGACWEGFQKFYKAQEGSPQAEDKPLKYYGRISLPPNLPADVLAELKETATKLCAPGKGFLAADESAGPWLRAGHAEAAKIPDVIENRAAYRSMCFSTPGLSEHISGVILHWETLFQDDADGKSMVDIITGNGMIPGIKVDKAYDKKGMWGTEVGPLGHPEVSTKGLDDLQERCAQAYKKGARFAKWRNVLQLDPKKSLPSNLAIMDTVHTLARYASICQSERLVPIVEPEIVPNGDHDIEYCRKMTEIVLAAQFKALADHRVYLEGAVLKPNMVKNGLKGPKADAETIAKLTVQTLLRTVPVAMPGIFFLSGETALNEDNEEEATVNLSTMHKLHPNLPWHLSFSYGKALQKTAIVTWLGKPENKAAAQKALKARSNANMDAVFGKYVKGSCPSVGTDGNVLQAAGPY